PSKDRIAATFHPLRPDTAQTDALRARYAGSAGQRPVVGVSWHSTNADKQLPEVGDWRVHLQELECWGLSLQYHPEAAGLRHFETEGQQI
ncbi:hypothetical protein JI667_21470, partial [Bacillus sp. NTK074B]|nr:hypothetical protein [Bacillus sp. NTK074B]